MPKPVAHGNILGFDFGLKRVGIATGSTYTRIAHPHSTIQRHDTALPPSLKLLFHEWKPVACIVGFPTHVDERTTQHPLQPACISFAQALADTFSCSIALVDEQLSSYAAEHNYRKNHRGPISKKDKAKIDAYAAQQILQDFLDGAPPYQWIEPMLISSSS